MSAVKGDLQRGIIGAGGRVKIRFVRADDDLTEILATCEEESAVGFAPEISTDPAVGLATRLSHTRGFSHVRQRLLSGEPELMDVWNWYTSTLVAVCRESGAVVGLAYMCPPSFLLEPQNPEEVVNRALIAVTKLAVVAVLPQWRSAGVGASLVDQARLAATDARLGIMFGQFTASDQLDRFYRARGFEILPPGAAVDATAITGLPCFCVDPDPAEVMFARKLQPDYPGSIIASKEQVEPYMRKRLLQSPARAPQTEPAVPEETSPTAEAAEAEEVSEDASTVEKTTVRGVGMSKQRQRVELMWAGGTWLAIVLAILWRSAGHADMVGNIVVGLVAVCTLLARIPIGIWIRRSAAG